MNGFLIKSSMEKVTTFADSHLYKVKCHVNLHPETVKSSTW